MKYIADRPETYGDESARLASFGVDVLTWVLENRMATIPSIRVHQITDDKPKDPKP